jgi:hypothetical protein
MATNVTSLLANIGSIISSHTQAVREAGQNAAEARQAAEKSGRGGRTGGAGITGRQSSWAAFDVVEGRPSWARNAQTLTAMLSGGRSRASLAGGGGAVEPAVPDVGSTPGGLGVPGGRSMPGGLGGGVPSPVPPMPATPSTPSTPATQESGGYRRKATWTGSGRSAEPATPSTPATPDRPRTLADIAAGRGRGSAVAAVAGMTGGGFGGGPPTPRPTVSRGPTVSRPTPLPRAEPAAELPKSKDTVRREARDAAKTFKELTQVFFRQLRSGIAPMPAAVAMQHARGKAKLAMQDLPSVTAMPAPPSTPARRARETEWEGMPDEERERRAKDRMGSSGLFRRGRENVGRLGMRRGLALTGRQAGRELMAFGAQRGGVTGGVAAMAGRAMGGAAGATGAAAAAGGGAAAAGAASGAGAAGAAGAAGGGGLAAAGAALANPVTATVAALAAVPVATLGVTKAFAAVAERTMEASRDLARFNGSIATTFAMLDKQELALKARTAAGTSGTASMLGESVMEMKEAMQPVNETMKNTMNLIGTGLAEVATIGANILNVILEPLDWLNRFAKDWFGSDDKSDKGIPIDIAWGRMMDAGKWSRPERVVYPSNQKPQEP